MNINTNTEKLLAHKDGAAGWITFNNPAKRNAMSYEMWLGLDIALDAFIADPAIRVIVLKGAGDKAFVSGADISEFKEKRANPQMVAEFNKVSGAIAEKLQNCLKPTIAMIRGFCMGGACHVAMSCDLRIAAPDAVFAIPAARLSIVYGVSATRKLMSLVGVSNAKRILYSAGRFDAAEALRIGFVNELADDPQAAAAALMDTLAANAPLTIAGAKVLLNGLATGTGALDPLQADAVIDRAVSSADYLESVRAFRAKRAPRFEGR